MASTLQRQGVKPVLLEDLANLSRPDDYHSLILHQGDEAPAVGVLK